MSTQEKDLPKDNQEDSSQDGEQTQQTSREENQVIDNNNQDKPNFDPNYVASLEARIAEQQIQNRRLENLIEGVRKDRSESRDQPRTRNVEEERNSFYQDPIGSLDSHLNDRDNKILSQMKEMLAPIQEVAYTFKSGNEYDRLKNMMRNDPIFGKALNDPDVERTVDAVMRNPNVQVSEDSIKSAIAQAYGIKSMGGLGGSSNRTNQQSNQPGNRVDPPQIPTTRTRVDAPESKKELTEDDRIAMRYAGLKVGNPEHEKEYWKLIGDETMTLRVHKDKKETK